MSLAGNMNVSTFNLVYSDFNCEFIRLAGLNRYLKEYSMKFLQSKRKM